MFAIDDGDGIDDDDGDGVPRLPGTAIFFFTPVIRSMSGNSKFEIICGYVPLMMMMNDDGGMCLRLTMAMALFIYLCLGHQTLIHICTTVGPGPVNRH